MVGEIHAYCQRKMIPVPDGVGGPDAAPIPQYIPQAPIQPMVMPQLPPQQPPPPGYNQGGPPPGGYGGGGGGGIDMGSDNPPPAYGGAPAYGGPVQP